MEDNISHLIYLRHEHIVLKCRLPTNMHNDHIHDRRLLNFYFEYTRTHRGEHSLFNIQFLFTRNF